MLQSWPSDIVASGIICRISFKIFIHAHLMAASPKKNPRFPIATVRSIDKQLLKLSVEYGKVEVIAIE